MKKKVFMIVLLFITASSTLSFAEEKNNETAMDNCIKEFVEESKPVLEIKFIMRGLKEKARGYCLVEKARSEKSFNKRYSKHDDIHLR